MKEKRGKEKERIEIDVIFSTLFLTIKQQLFLGSEARTKPATSFSFNFFLFLLQFLSLSFSFNFILFSSSLQFSFINCYDCFFLLNSWLFLTHHFISFFFFLSHFKKGEIKEIEERRKKERMSRAFDSWNEWMGDLVVWFGRKSNFFFHSFSHSHLFLSFPFSFLSFSSLISFLFSFIHLIKNWMMEKKGRKQVQMNYKSSGESKRKKKWRGVRDKERSRERE